MKLPSGSPSSSDKSSGIHNIAPAPAWLLGFAATFAVLCQWYLRWQPLDVARAGLERLPWWLDFLLSSFGFRIDNASSKAVSLLYHIIVVVAMCSLPTVLMLTWKRLVQLSYKSLFHPEYLAFIRNNALWVVVAASWRYFAGWVGDMSSEFFNVVTGIIAALVSLSSFCILMLLDAPLTPYAKCDTVQMNKAAKTAEYFVSEIMNATLWNSPLRVSGDSVPAQLILSGLLQTSHCMTLCQVQRAMRSQCRQLRQACPGNFSSAYAAFWHPS